RHRAVAGAAVGGDADFHAAAVAAEDRAVGRVGDDHRGGLDLVFFDDVLPAEAVAVFFHDGAGEQQAELRGVDFEVAENLGRVDHRWDGAFLVAGAAAPDATARNFAIVRIVLPLLGIANADGVDVGV